MIDMLRNETITPNASARSCCKAARLPGQQCLSRNAQSAQALSRDKRGDPPQPSREVPMSDLISYWA